MTSDVKWIKIVTDIFDDEKMQLIDGLPEHDAIIVIWFKLLCLAGKQNNGGVFTMNDKIAYTDEMLSMIFRRPLNTVRLALETFIMYGMIEIIDNVITIPTWNKHQSLDSYEKKLIRDRQYQTERRAKQRELLSQKSPDNRLTTGDKSSLVAVSETEGELDREEEYISPPIVPPTGGDKDEDDEEEDDNRVVSEACARTRVESTLKSLGISCKAADKEKYRQASEIAHELYRNTAGRSPTATDIMNVYNRLFYRGDSISDDDISVLACAFAKAGNAGHAGQWTYIAAILDDMKDQGIRSKTDAGLYYISAKGKE